jgi:phytol kinase
MLQTWLEICVVLVAGTGMMAGLSIYQAIQAPHPEFSRKLLHIGTGLLALTFPWMFESAWPVLVVVGAFMFVLCATRMPGTLRRWLGGALIGVDRASNGDLWFLLAIGLVFVLAGDHTLFYIVPILVLTLADAAAAVVGVAFGRLRYSTIAGAKSLEGSAAFFGVAFLCAGIALLVSGDYDYRECFAIAAALAFATTILEALSNKGLDNIFVPAGAYLVLYATL